MREIIELRKSGVSFEEFSTNEKYENIFEEFKKYAEYLKRLGLEMFLDDRLEELELDSYYFYTKDGQKLSDYDDLSNGDLEILYKYYDGSDNYFYEYFKEEFLICNEHFCNDYEIYEKSDNEAIFFCNSCFKKYLDHKNKN